jgi:hypothetical protein
MTYNSDTFEDEIPFVISPTTVKFAGKPSRPPVTKTPPHFDSLIVTTFPSIFEEFRNSEFFLLWRGSRNGFTPKSFHDNCDGHINTLILIRDSQGFIFGGFTPISWESRVWNGKHGAEHNCPKADESCKSFLFTVKNPRETSPMKFPLKVNRKQFALYCSSKYGPTFGYWGCDLSIQHPMTTGNECHTLYFGCNYQFDLEVESTNFLTGSEKFNVDEIEVFEVHPHQ